MSLSRHRQMKPVRPSKRRAALLRTLALVTIGFLSVPLTVHLCDAAESPFGRLELDVESDYSHIRVRKRNSIRSLIFVRDSGEEKLETQMDLRKPHELRFAYTQFMFLSYLFRPHHEKVLLVGLGGGSMVHFLKRYDPPVKVDAIDIDPAVVKIADEYFGIRSEGNVNVLTADGFKFLKNAKSQYDVIYMDAFLEPSRETDSTGAPLRLRTLQFYETVIENLKPDGLVVFNLNPHRNVKQDVDTIRDAFPQIYVFRLPRKEGLVVVASTSSERMRNSTMSRKAKELDQRFGTKFSFRPMIRGVRR